MRLSQSEVKQFRETEICFDKVQLGNTALIYQVHMAEVEQPNAYLTNNTLSVEVPYEIGEKWAGDNEMVHFEHVQTLEGGDSLHILVEKDYTCINPQRGEDETDNYPNPRKSH